MFVAVQGSIIVLRVQRCADVITWQMPARKLMIMEN